MEVLTKEQLWRCMLKAEPKRKSRSSFWWEGFCYFLAMFFNEPRKAAGEIAGLLLIAAGAVLLIFTAGVLR